MTKLSTCKLRIFWVLHTREERLRENNAHVDDIRAAEAKKRKSLPAILTCPNIVLETREDVFAAGALLKHIHGHKRFWFPRSVVNPLRAELFQVAEDQEVTVMNDH